MFKKTLPAALLIACLGSAADAATFAISGTQTGNNFGVAYTPAPTFAGTLVGDAASGFAAGTLWFAPYSDDTGAAVYTSPDASTDFAASGAGSVNGAVVSFSDIATVDHFPGTTCTGSCFPAPDGAPGLLNMTLTFADSDHFSGVASIVYTGSYAPYTRTFSFTGTAVPVPAAAWLFGSGLLGMAGARRAKSLRAHRSA